ncbi:DDRGK domain-containing protein 1-like [Brevipalpus obovatus]|uniref:DDRGK domain-containing protein 1-like n=1 Tax=Brevipalpus obovatus TaxID=246614 RepID=UPI003D9E32F3
MSDLILLFTALGSLITLLLVGFIAWKGSKTSLASENDDEDEEESRPRTVPRPVASDAPFRRAARQRRNRIQPQRVERVERDDSDNDYDGGDGQYSDEELEAAAEESSPKVVGKIGVKKQRKLEAKAEKKAMREQELQEREERKERQAQLDEERRKKEEAEREEEKRKEEEERKIREEKERKEHEEYLKMKEAFEVEGEGFDQDIDETEQQNKLQAFIDYIKNEKVVLLEDLAGNFQMRTQDAINRINALLEDQQITGVIDDRGKFIYITPEELKEFAKFIKRRGRVSIAELVENSSQLIKMKS